MQMFDKLNVGKIHLSNLDNGEFPNESVDSIKWISFQNMPIGVNEEDINFRKSVITFMRDIDPVNEFGYKELTRLWIAEKGHPQTNGERTMG